MVEDVEEERKREIDQALIDLMSDNESVICNAAVTLAINAKKGYLSKNALDFLVSLISHPSEKVRQSVMAALVAYAERECADREALVKLVGSFYAPKRKGSEEILDVDFKCSEISRAAGIRCIERYAAQDIYDPTALDLLIEILRQDKSPQNRHLAAITLQRYAEKNMLDEENKKILRALANEEIHDSVRVTIKKIVGLE
ncbi:MAG: hypothetical protein ACTSP1_01740 [Candidatus Freyarchaeota archaeon]